MSFDLVAGLADLDADFMPDTCSITRAAPGAQNADGSFADGATTTVTYACRVAPLGSSPVEQSIAARLTNVTPFTFALEYGADVTERDTIAYRGATYQVLGVLAPASFATSVRAVTKRIS